MSQPPTNSGRSGGTVSRWVETLKGLSFTNVLVLLVLMVGIAPAYLAWHIINDEELRDIVFSSYRTLQGSGDCVFRRASEVGAESNWFVTRNFALSGAVHWYIGVSMPVQPTPDQIATYCSTLTQLIIYARERSIPKPDFPDNGEPFIKVE